MRKHHQLASQVCPYHSDPYHCVDVAFEHDDDCDDDDYDDSACYDDDGDDDDETVRPIVVAS